MKYPKHVLAKIMSNPKLKKRHEKEEAARKAKVDKPSSKNGS